MEIEFLGEKRSLSSFEMTEGPFQKLGVKIGIENSSFVLFRVKREILSVCHCS
jgi:hypothetical protein